jgi:hypothetical protein
MRSAWRTEDNETAFPVSLKRCPDTSLVLCSQDHVNGYQESNSDCFVPLTTTAGAIGRHYVDRGGATQLFLTTCYYIGYIIYKIYIK